MKITGHKKILFVTIFFLLFTFMLANTATAQDPDSVTKLTAGIFAATEARFGQAVAISDTVMVVGAPGGRSAYVFTNDGTSWNQGEQLIAPDPALSLNFGQSVATGGNLVVVGAPGARSAYVFTNDGTGWNQGEKLSAPDPALAANFGQSVATNGNLVVVGAPGARSAYVFTKGETDWEPEALPTPPYSILFGWSVATDGMRIVVGDPAKSSVYVFTQGETDWEDQEISLIQANWFGSSVSISGDFVAVGAPSDLPITLSQHFDGPGSAYVFAYDQDRSAWDQTPQQASPALPAPGFGISVSISRDRLAVSAPLDNVDDDPGLPSPGAVYLFKRKVDGNKTNWVEFDEQFKVTARDGHNLDAEVLGRFGWSVSVSLDGSMLAVGAPFHNVSDGIQADNAGAAYVYTLPSENKAPIAHAVPPYQEVVEGYTVYLDGSASSDPDGDDITFAWVQIGDPEVKLLPDSSAQEPSFKAPELTKSCATLKFELTVTEYLNGEPGLSSEPPATVEVKVIPTNEIHGKLGGKHHHWLYWNKYSFYGHENEKVTINLQADDSGWHRGNKATLILKDKIWGKRLRVADGGDLPKTITAELPSDGEYAIYVLKQPWYWFWRHNNSFEGDYILTLEGTCGKLGTSYRCKNK